MDTTEIQDDFSTETASAADNGVEASPTPAESIKKSGAEEATEQVKKTVTITVGYRFPDPCRYRSAWRASVSPSIFTRS